MFLTNMQSHTSLSNVRFHYQSHLELHASPKGHCFLPVTRLSRGFYFCRLRLDFSHASQLTISSVQRHGSVPHRCTVQVNAMDEDSAGTSALDDWDYQWSSGIMVSSSDEEESGGEVFVSVADVDLPSINDHSHSPDEALRVTSHRLAMLGIGRPKSRSRSGVLINLALIIFLMLFFLLADWCAWRIVRLPLAPYYLSRPFLISSVLACFAGYIFVPLFDILKIHKIQRGNDPVWGCSRRRTLTMGGLFFVPISIIVAEVIVGFSSTELFAASVVTFSFGLIGLFIDTLALVRKHNTYFSVSMKCLLEVVVATCFSFWLDAANISSPYGMKMLIPLPPPLGLVSSRKYYLFLSSLSFVCMGNGVHLTDAPQGLAAGAAALAFTGMAIAVLPICAEVSIFGASFAGACAGFLVHNQFNRVPVIMGNTGALAVGGALSVMAACTGMFFPLFISSPVFLFHTFSLIIQVLNSITRRRLFRKNNFQCHFRMHGIESSGAAYTISCILAMAAACIGIISA